MQRNVLETVMGAVVLCIAVGFVALAYQGRGTQTDVGAYALSAAFADASGVSVGTDIRISGVKVGVVSAMSLNSESYQAEVSMQIAPNIQLPTDSSASVVGDGLLGSKYIALTPGADEDMLAAGDVILYTQSAVSLEQLIGKLVFSGGGLDENSASKNTNTDSGLGLESDLESVDEHDASDTQPTP